MIISNYLFSCTIYKTKKKDTNLNVEFFSDYKNV